MKNILKTSITAFIICLIPFSIVAGQEKKNEQKIKIIIDDGTGKKVVIDTLLNDDKMTDSLKLKNGNVIFIGHPEEETGLRHDESNKQVFVTVTNDGKDNKKVVKEITIVSSDSAGGKEDFEGSKIYVYSDSKTPEGRPGEQHKVIHWSDKDRKGPAEKVIIINDRKVIEKEGGETIGYTVNSNDRECEVENTKYVISKDGMVITIEGGEYDKVKELVKEIESKLDSKKEGTENTKAVKEEQKKAVKKK